jgi:hypothetical protein
MQSIRAEIKTNLVLINPCKIQNKENKIIVLLAVHLGACKILPYIFPYVLWTRQQRAWRAGTLLNCEEQLSLPHGACPRCPGRCQCAFGVLVSAAKSRNKSRNYYLLLGFLHKVYYSESTDRERKSKREQEEMKQIYNFCG